jgi:hypothetical protein
VSSIEYQKKKIVENGMRYADRILQEFSDNYVIKGLELAEKYAKSLFLLRSENV